MELRIREDDVIEQPVVETNDEQDYHTVTITVNENVYEVKFPESRRADVVYGLRGIAEKLEDVRV